MNEAELLFTDILNCDRLSLYLNKNTLLDKDKASLISSALKRRINGEPIQYILGRTEFMGLEFKVTPDVLIPRPETEILVETVIEYVTKSPPQAGPPSAEQGHKATSINILDMGTGSGCIAVSLAKFIRNSRVTAIDISKGALKIAGGNAGLNNVADKIKFIQSDLFDSPHLETNAFDLIVSNPPYISTAEIDLLQPEVRREPRIALDAGKDGLGFYRRIIDSAWRYLKKGGFLAMEMGFNQGEAIKNIFQNSGYFEIIEVVKDYNGIDRAVMAIKREKKNG